MKIFAVHLDAVLSLVHSNVISQGVNRMTKMLMEPAGLSLESFLFLSFCFFPPRFMWENYRTYFQRTGRSVLMCQHQVNSSSLLFIKLPVPPHIIYVSSVMLLQGMLLREKK